MLNRPVRPVTYKDWRALYHSEVRELGWYVEWLFDGRRISTTRELHERIRRLKRISRRLRLEFDVMDRTCAEALLELIFEDKCE